MAIYHLHATLIRRSQGRSAVAAAAYRSASRLHDETLGVTHNFTRKSGVIHTEVLLPAGAPTWAQDRAALWNAVEKAEVRRDAQLAREVRVALPVELSPQAQIALLRTFCREQFTARGMVVDLALHHDNPNNPHAHIGLTLRCLTPEGFGPKERSWNSRDLLLRIRENWAHTCNRALVRAGQEARIDHRSHLERGLELEPTCKVGMDTAKTQDTRKDLITDRLAHNRSVRQHNGEKILRDPTVALEALTAHEATFSQRRLGHWLERHTASPQQKEACHEAVMAHREVRPVGRTRWGEDLYSTRQMLSWEWELLRLGKTMAQQQARAVPADALAPYAAALGLSREQAQAARWVTERSGQLAVVEGWAGTGKSRLFAAARRTWEVQGLRVVGAALSGQAAAGLGQSAGLRDSRSLAAWTYAWDRGEARLGPRDVLVVDEASLVGTRQMAQVLHTAHHGGAKVVLVGDTHQLQAIEAGSPLRALGQVAGRAMLRDIRRQAEPWQRQASAALAAGQVHQALRAYRQNTYVCRGEVSAQASIARAWVEKEQGPEGGKVPSQVALAHRRKDVEKLNQAIRQARRKAGLLGPETKDLAVKTSRGIRHFASGDRICFLRNDRGLGVFNGTTGVVAKVDVDRLHVQVEGRSAIVLPLQRYADIDHGYALTVHKAQGVTVDHTHLWATRGLDRHATYVAMTRHREGLGVHVQAPDFRTRKDFLSCLSRSRPKGMALAVVDGIKDRRERLQERTVRKEKSEARQTARYEALMTALAKSRTEAYELRRALEKPSLTLKAAVADLPAVREQKEKLKRSKSVVDSWSRLKQVKSAEHPVRCRLGMLGSLRVTSPQTGRLERLDEGMHRATLSQKKEEIALQKVLARAETISVAQRQVRDNERHRDLKIAVLIEAERREQANDIKLQAFRKRFSEARKSSFLKSYGHRENLEALQTARSIKALEKSGKKIKDFLRSIGLRVEAAPPKHFLARLEAKQAGAFARLDRIEKRFISLQKERGSRSAGLDR